MPLRRPFATLVPLLAIALAMVSATPAQAQVLGPVQGLPNVQVPGVGLPGMVPASPLRSVDDLLRGPLALTRKLQIDALRRSEPRRVDVDPHGAPILRGEFLAMGLSTAQRDAVQASGFVVDRETPADATLGLDFVVLHDTHNRSTARARRALQRAAPDATFTYQHLYLPAGHGDVARATNSAPPSSSAPTRRVGLVDGGVDPRDPALAHARIEPHGCQTATASRHGTAVAARLVAGDPDTLYAADLWCGDAVGGATSNLVDALAWMAREHVAVINISLVGPDNPVLARAVQAMIARGHVLVSAVGNDGPAAPPLFPASYPGVIGVGGVDAHDRALPESGSGDQVDFCASGVLGSGRNALRGTSFAAPIVARKAAQLLDAPHAGAAAQVQQQLIGEARPLGAPGHDPRYGYGLLSP
ncbi:MULTISPECIES: S8 family serine peptidase [Rhodanobacter]|nr:MULTISPECIES: S8 family serine peptidase [Rhodanobacter]UJJ52594.1 S8 family serine peptidase [Rhodanobacter denitrificans]UJM89079.1 S8 family serine peptidase [Rhodanobacter denitrificans]UJM95348.1 S8 family serine peptidase [Rhodanobacter denitrificans]UJM98879.1 S8 family serine peptidase [Rhodanobacter denitrificans]UJN21706.1 S8 family serine peptidase [Rhodanobacter denitrificans]